MFFFFCRKYSNQSQKNGDIQSLQIPRVELINVFKDGVVTYKGGRLTTFALQILSDQIQAAVGIVLRFNQILVEGENLSRRSYSKLGVVQIYRIVVVRHGFIFHTQL